MIGRNTQVLVAVVFALSALIALAGLVSAPPGFWATAQAHYPGLVVLLAVDWGLVPLALLCGVFSNPINRLVWRGRPISETPSRWMERILTVMALYMLAAELLQTGGRIAAWNHIGGFTAREVYGIADPGHQIVRLGWVAAGAVFAWVGNGLPKLPWPSRDPRVPSDWTRVKLPAGWIITVCGLAFMVCAAVMPLREAVPWVMALVAAMVVGPLIVWIIVHFSGRPSAE